ncbi:MAG: hypothetical protein V4495_21055 [Pseudomonadota bacterium]
MTRNLKEMLISGASLRAQVFHHSFDRYLFFDIDICTSCELMHTVQKLVRAGFGLDGAVEVYSASEYESLNLFRVADDWVQAITSCEKYLRNSGDYGGLILLDTSKQWALFQPRPVDMGIFAFNSQVEIEKFVPDICDYFFSCADIRNWISRKTEHDVALVETVGYEVLNSLIKNYCV